MRITENKRQIKEMVVTQDMLDNFHYYDDDLFDSLVRVNPYAETYMQILKSLGGIVKPNTFKNVYDNYKLDSAEAYFLFAIYEQILSQLYVIGMDDYTLDNYFYMNPKMGEKAIFQVYDKKIKSIKDWNDYYYN